MIIWYVWCISWKCLFPVCPTSRLRTSESHQACAKSGGIVDKLYLSCLLYTFELCQTSAEMDLHYCSDFAINHHYCQLWRSMKLDCSRQFLAITGWGLIRNHMIFSAICCWKAIQEKLWRLKHTLYEGISDVVDTVPVMKFFRFVWIPLWCTFC